MSERDKLTPATVTLPRGVFAVPTCDSVSTCRAAENLKTKTMTYSASSQEWEQYFTRFPGEWNSGYVNTDEPDSSSLYIAAAVIIAPLLFAAYLIFR